MLGRRRRSEDPIAAVQPAAVPAHLQGLVHDALAARDRWLRTAERFASGPLQARVRELGGQVDAGVLAIWRAAMRVAELEQVTASLDVEQITADYKAAKRDPLADPALIAALEAKHRTAHRLLNSVDDAAGRLRLLDARLDAAVLQATELLLTGGDEETTELAAVVEELGLLQRTLAQLSA
ncbi:MAG: hypothetical protein ACLGI8_13835 [Acidimicrobiia bacterium]|jgi:hypothetical protein